MGSLKNDIVIRLLKISNLIFVPVPIITAWWMFYASRTYAPFYYWGNWVITLLCFVIYFYFGKAYDAFVISYNRISETVISMALATFLSDFVMYAIILLLYKHIPNPLPVMAAYVVQLAIAVVWAYYANLIYYRLFPAKRTAVMYDTRRGMTDIIHEYKKERKFNVVKSLSAEECLDDLSVLEDMEVVLLS